MNSRTLIRASSLHARRGGQAWTTPVAVAVAGGALAAWVATADTSTAASWTWLVGCVLAFALAFVRVPFHIYWRADAALLAQLPIPGRALFDAASWRCARAAVATGAAAAVGALPLLRFDALLAVRALTVIAALTAVAAGLIPAVSTFAATLVVTSARGDNPVPPGVLGAAPGAVSAFAIAGVVFDPRWLAVSGAGIDHHALPEVLAVLAAVSVVAWVAARAVGTPHMPAILRNISALDRQLLATLEIHPPTAIERAIATAIGEAAAPTYRKLARLVRRRHPMAYALGALAFAVLVVVGAVRPASATVWIVATVAAVAVYAGVMARRLARPPLELPRLTATLPIAPAAVARARVAWVVGWLAVFVAGPAVFAIARTL